jgi:hypothetical protein
MEANDIKRISALVCHFQPPLLPGPELAVDIPEHLSGYDSGLAPSGFVIGQFLTLGIEV